MITFDFLLYSSLLRNDTAILPGAEAIVFVFLSYSPLIHKQIPCAILFRYFQIQTLPVPASPLLDSHHGLDSAVAYNSHGQQNSQMLLWKYTSDPPLNLFQHHLASSWVRYSLSWSLQSLLDFIVMFSQKALSYQVCHGTHRSPYHSSSILAMSLPQNLYISFSDLQVLVHSVHTYNPIIQEAELEASLGYGDKKKRQWGQEKKGSCAGLWGLTSLCCAKCWSM